MKLNPGKTEVPLVGRITDSGTEVSPALDGAELPLKGLKEPVCRRGAAGPGFLLDQLVVVAAKSLFHQLWQVNQLPTCLLWLSFGGASGIQC